MRQAFTDNASDTNVVCGPGATLTNVYRSGGKFDFCTALTILEQREQAGDAVFRGGGVTLGTVTLYSGSLILRPTADNTELTNIVLGPGTVLDLSKCMFSVRCPNPVVMYKDAQLIDPFDRLATATPTDGSPDPLINITPAGCATADLKLTRKSGKTGTRI